MPGPDEYVAGLLRLIQRGVRVHMVYADSSMGRYDLYRLRRRLPEFRDDPMAIRIMTVSRSDHLFTRVAAKAQLGHQLLDLIDALSTPASTAPNTSPILEPRPSAAGEHVDSLRAQG